MKETLIENIGRVHTTEMGDGSWKDKEEFRTWRH